MNSAESFDGASGEFYAELLFYKNRGVGSGWKKNNPGNMSYEQMLKKKKCIVTIKNKDELCFSRAVITMKALADDDPHYPELRDGRWRQGMLAKKLHREVGVPEGPCGLQEIKQIQQKVGPTYQIKVFEGQQGCCGTKTPRLMALRRKFVF